mmetsp:Transcript_48704/g.123010  ORF Transcript_48704/g.123010 Transcript_48704/m.123010 type:complete len:524 (-) Transcript_48704:420-1991(-)
MGCVRPAHMRPLLSITGMAAGAPPSTRCQPVAKPSPPQIACGATLSICRRSGPAVPAAAVEGRSAAPRGGGTGGDEALMAWAATSDVQAPALRVADFAGLRGMTARTDIAPDDTVVSLPKGRALLVVPRQSCGCPELVDPSFWSSAPWFLKMSLLLLAETRKGAQSRLAGYVQSLPEGFDTPFHWEPADLAQLQYQPLVRLVEQQQQEWADAYQRLKEATPSSPLSYTELVWGMECVRSRCFSGPYTGGSIRQRIVLGATIIGLAAFAVASQHVLIEDALNGLIAAFGFNILYDFFLSQKLKWYAVCPVIDHMNHKSTVESDVSWEYFSDRFVVTATQGWKAGEQVYINYGKQSNDSLLQYYGFVEEENPNDTFVVDDMGRFLLEAAGGEVQARGRRWQDANLSEQLAQVTLSRKGVPAAALVAARLLVMTDADAQRGLESANAELEAAKEAQALGLVAGALKAVEASMGSSLAQDQKALKGELSALKMDERLRLALQFRVEKKQLLQQVGARLVAQQKAKAG